MVKLTPQFILIYGIFILEEGVVALWYINFKLCVGSPRCILSKTHYSDTHVVRLYTGLFKRLELPSGD